MYPVSVRPCLNWARVLIGLSPNLKPTINQLTTHKWPRDRNIYTCNKHYHFIQNSSLTRENSIIFKNSVRNFIMRSIQLQSTLFSLNFELNHRKQLQTPILSMWFSGHEPARIGTIQRKKLHFSFQGRTRAMMGSSSTPIVLDLTSPAKSVDLAIFLQTRSIFFHHFLTFPNTPFIA